MGASLDIKGLAEAQGLMVGLSNDFGDLTELHEWLVIDSQSTALDQYPTAPGLAPLTRKARIHGGSQVMLDSGRLWRSITGAGAPGISKEDGSLNTANERWGRLGTNLIYAAIHQTGGEITPKRTKFLAVPMTAKAAKAGSPRDFGAPLALLKLKSRPGFLMVEGVQVTIQRGPNKGKIRIRVKPGKAESQYLLVKSIRISKRAPVPSAEQVLPGSIDTTNRWVAYKIQRRM